MERSDRKMAELTAAETRDPVAAQGPRTVALTAFALCFAASLVEGFDIQSAGLMAPKFAPLFHLAPSQVGWVFTFNTFGLFLGAALGGWISDRRGRKIVLTTSMLLFGLFSLGTAAATSGDTLILMRFLTGLGLGGAMPNLIAISAEAGGHENRATRVTMITAGLPFGGAIAGLLTWFGGAELDWKVIFYVGGVAPLLLAAALYLFLQSPPRARAEAEPRRVDTSVALFGGGRALRTLMLWIGFFFTLVVLYLMLNWMPMLLVGKGFSKAAATAGALMFSLGGGVGAQTLALALRRFGPRLVVTAAHLGMGVGLFATAAVERDIGVLLVAAFGAGFFVIGAQILLYGFASTLYPAVVRGTGVGWGVAVGRLGAVAGPALATAILVSGRGPSVVIMATLPVIALSYVAVMAITWRAAPSVD